MYTRGCHKEVGLNQHALTQTKSQISQQAFREQNKVVVILSFQQEESTATDHPTFTQLNVRTYTLQHLTNLSSFEESKHGWSIQSELHFTPFAKYVPPNCTAWHGTVSFYCTLTLDKNLKYTMKRLSG